MPLFQTKIQDDMLKIMRRSTVSGIISWITLYSFLIMLSGCFYFRVRISSDEPARAITNFQSQNKNIYLHVDEKVWSLKNISITTDTVSGKKGETTVQYRSRYVNPEKTNRYKKFGPASELYLLNEVHIYVAGFTEAADNKVSFPMKSISKIEVYDPDTGTTIASWVFGIAGTAVAAYGLLAIIALLMKTSCPFVYTFDGDNFTFNGEIFSGATQPGLERDDYLPLTDFTSNQKNYKLKLTNEVHEIQYVNLSKLAIVDHSKGSCVLIDKYGKIQTSVKPVLPISASNRNGMDILPLISSKDKVIYSGDEKNIQPDGIEEIVLKFLRPAGCTSAKLFIRARNTFWLDGLFSRFHSLFGARYESFNKKQASSPGTKLTKYLLDQDIPLSVYVNNGNEWKSSDYFNIAGPMAFRDDVLPLDLSGISTDTVSVKLRTGFQFWEIDYAAMDFGPNEQVSSVVVEPISVIDQAGTNKLEQVSSRDKEYAVLKEVGDEITITFPAPSLQDSSRSVFLHTSGYYTILRDLSGKADKNKLDSFRHPGRFPRFSKEEYEKGIGKN